MELHALLTAGDRKFGDRAALAAIDDGIAEYSTRVNGSATDRGRSKT